MDAIGLPTIPDDSPVIFNYLLDTIVPMQLLALALQAAGPQAVRRLLLSSSSFDGLAQVALRLLSLHIRRLAMRNATNTVPSSNGHGHMVNNIASGHDCYPWRVLVVIYSQLYEPICAVGSHDQHAA